MPFFGAILFAASSLAYKQAFSQGARVSQAFLANNLCLVVLFLPLFALEQKAIPWAHIGYPVLAGSVFFTANILNFKAIEAGDVSLVTPLMGTKVLFVALFARWTFGAPGGATQVLAAAMTTVGIFLLGVTENRGGRWMGPATAYALASSCSFASCDILMQQWAPAFGVFHFLPIMFLCVGLLSVASVFLRGPIGKVSWVRGGKWVAVAALMMGIQAILIATSISLFRDATGVNIVYSLRGIWGIVIVWLLGKRVASLERGSGSPGSLWIRALGSALILAAVVLAIRSTRWQKG